MLLYACAVVLMAVSTSIMVINIGVAGAERVLVTVAGAMLFLLSAYGFLVWARRRKQRRSAPA